MATLFHPWAERTRWHGIAAVLIATATAQAAMAQTTTCDRSCLTEFADRYLEAIAKHDPALVAHAPGAKLAENHHLIKAGEGIWKTATSFAKTRQYVADTETGQVGVQTILTENNQPVIFALRLKIVNRAVTEAETLVTHDGEGGPPFLPEGFLIRESPYMREVPKEIRSTRAQLLQAAGRYWELATSTHKADEGMYAVDCFHFQNGQSTNWERSLSPAEQAAPERNAAQAYDGRIWICARELVLTTAPWIKQRSVRTLVDVERGLVMTWNLVDVQGRPGPDGKIPPAPKAGEPIPPVPDNAPPGLSAIGWAMRSQAQTFYHAEVKRIIGGKIQREQIFQRALPENVQPAF